MQLNTNNNNNTNTPSKNNLFAHDTWILTKEFYQQHLSLPFLSINFQFYQKYHLLTIKNCLFMFDQETIIIISHFHMKTEKIAC